MTIPQTKGLAQDLKDCTSPTLQMPTAGAAHDFVTVGRPESSPVAAECMGEKSYWKEYRPLTGMFP